MSGELDVMWRGVRAWLESVRRASAGIEPLVREIRALEDARDEMLGWRTKASGSGHGAGAHSDPTAKAAEQRMCELDGLIEDKQAEWQRKMVEVGACGEVLEAMAVSIGEKHALAIELYYIDCADTWSEVACEMDVTYRRVCQLRTEAYAWIDANWRGIIRPFPI